jgi:hypothetical protein
MGAQVTAVIDSRSTFCDCLERRALIEAAGFATERGS